MELDASVGYSLYNRLKDNAASIEQATNLRLDNFLCRYAEKLGHSPKTPEQILQTIAAPLEKEHLEDLAAEAIAEEEAQE